LEGEVAEAAEEIIRENCKELDIEIIDMAMNVDHVHLFIKYPPKYSVSWIAKRIKGRSSKLLRDRFPQLKEWCPGHLWAPSCYHGSVGHGWRKNLERTKPGIYRFITNFLEGHIKNRKKSKSFYIPMSYL
jgi:putative transposase